MPLSLQLGCGLSANHAGSSGGGGGSDSVTFGALTLAGAGGVAKPSGATAISDAGGTNLVLTSGEAVPDTGGTVTSGTVTWDDGTEWTVTASANTYSTKADATEIEAAHAAATLSATTTCLVREGTSTDEIDLTGRVFTGSFTIKGSGFATNSATRPNGYTWGTSIGNVLLTGENVYFEDIAFQKDFATAVSALIYQSANVAIDGFHAKRCKFSGTDLGTFTEELLATVDDGATELPKLFPAVTFNQTANADNVLFEDCYFHDLSQAVYVRGSNWTAKGNYSQDFWNGWIGCGPGDTIEVSNNEHVGIWGSVDDPGDAHGGMGGGTIFSATPASNGICKGNVVLLGNARQLHEEDQTPARHTVTAIDLTGITGYKLNDANASTEAYDTWEVSHNIFHLANGTGINLENGINADMHHNTLVGIRGTTDDPIAWGGQPGFNYEETGTFAMTGNKIRHNICAPDQGLNDIISQIDTFQLYENVSVVNTAAATTGATTQRTYDEYFVGDATKDFGADLTTAEAILAFAPKSGTHADTANIGAVNDYYTLGIPGKDASDTTPAFTRPDSSGNATATGHAYNATVWDGTYGLELDNDATSGTAMLDGGATVSDGKELTVIFQGTFDGDTSQHILAQAASLDIDFKRLGNGSTQQNRMFLQTDSASDNTERACVYSPIHPITNAMGKVTVAISYDLANDRVCSAVNGVPFDLSDDNDFQVADINANLSASNVHLLESIFGADRFDGELEALIIENEFIDLTTTAGLESLFAADGHLLSPTSVKAAFTASEPLIFLAGNAAAFNGGTGNSNGRSQAVSVTNSGTVTDVSGSNVDEGSSTGTFSTSGGSRVVELTNGQTLVVTNGFTPTGVEFVGGGGGGGFRAGGGGGAGELIQDTSTPPALTAQTYTATVGAGGAGDTSGTSPGASGGDTELVGGTTDDVTIIALGGGGGGTSNAASDNGTYGGNDGGSGGGTAGTNQTTRYGRSTASDGVGNDGGNGSFTNTAGGGGGGSAAVGGAESSGTGGSGGAGTSSITPGKSDTLAAGGDAGDNITSGNGANGVNFGDGGEGGSENIVGRDGGDGASGIIRIWWPV